MAGFGAQVGKFARNFEEQADKKVRAITFALFREVIRRTPVDKGRLKGNWQCTISSPAFGTVEIDDKSGSKTIAQMAANMGGLGSTTYLTNNLPYAHRIEYDGWSHTKAPAGMVRVSFARIQGIARQHGFI